MLIPKAYVIEQFVKGSRHFNLWAGRELQDIAKEHPALLVHADILENFGYVAYTIDLRYDVKEVLDDLQRILNEALNP